MRDEMLGDGHTGSIGRGGPSVAFSEGVARFSRYARGGAMSFYPDLSIWTDLPGVALRAVGWLDPAHEHATGEVSEEVFGKLVELLVDPWQPLASARWFPCPWCRFTGGAGELLYRDHAVAMGTTNLFVPGDEVVYVAPSLVVHYIDAHGYAPPDEFQEAVLKCPEMRSREYLHALREHGVRLSQ